MERNLRDMADFAKDASIRLTPHSKTHKSPELALKQISYGSSAVCVQKVSEAEVMAESGVRKLLLSNEIIGLDKLRRLTQLAKKNDIRVCVDSSEGIEQLSQVANEADVRIKCLIDVDCGYHRCGVKPTEAPKLAKQITGKRNLSVQGIMGYEGHVGGYPRRQWPRLVRAAMKLTLQAKKKIEENAIHVEDVVVGGTSTAKLSGRYPGITEITPGEYIFYDYANVKAGLVPLDACALSVRSTVMSKPEANRIVIDGGLKTFCFEEAEYPRLKNPSIRGHFLDLSEEHGIIRLMKGAQGVKIGDIIEILPYRVGPCINLHDKMFLTRNGRLESTIPVLGRGMST
jgi:D-serine deaminase-like pyridoxal phosphate-dependent protein